MTEHTGSLVSGVVRCTCGWKSNHYALGSEAQEEFLQHLKDVQSA